MPFSTIGGKDEAYRNLLRRRRAMPVKTRALAAVVSKRFPTIGPVEVAFSWCGTFAETPDGLAYIGGHAGSPVSLRLGFGGNGITYSALAAQYLASGIVDGSYPDASRLFDLARPEIEPSSD